MFETITFTNFGYLSFTKNLIGSIKKNEVNINLRTFALDDMSYEQLSKISDNVVLYKDEDFKITEFIKQDENIFAELMYKKLEIIYTSLLKNEYVLYVDGDVVFKKNPTDYLMRSIGDLDILFQNDKNPNKPKKEILCAGFMFIKSNEKTLKYFNPENISQKRLYKGNHDQTYLNKIKRKFKYDKLPQDEYPNGIHFYNNYRTLNPTIIHFNYVLGELKEQKMKEHDEWYI